jgi:hypothetical protein
VLCQAIEDLTVLTIAQSMYNVAASLFREDNPVYEIVVTHLARWADLFDSLANIEDSIY